MPPSEEEPLEVREAWDRRPYLTWVIRGTLLLFAMGMIGVLSIAFWLSPYEADGRPKRMATHHQLGLPPCSFLLATGKPCPSCGMTTSFSLLMHGDILGSVQANWVGTLLAILGIVLTPWMILSGMRGRWAWGIHDVERRLISFTLLFILLALVRWGFVLGWRWPI
ncbi:DUF2752 domain-containing protein [Tuwongella immobilis]|uniref:DUF2752 domain-containing protein n=1 Tax=Tuwongella immobilis TaxID=692036 RepID=A0A6C2YKZ9_9BACT|nr:DUF2752 domain-containing protein [Tuwongella immobilis]VIP02047.1 Uncharacterized protein OS=Singulisphaera acidiphila (strain ATCC BAA-1392 / DSM 18658 / VKM B-2454 / MOB10) GN=Sinac_3151 PE=4 SV=1: DUF2752 [Tuwongella immobilis]VTS00228.1 Uncharacterized protein OS=Singulisphaera acidiphila (strain ATCC BAA-1392 / DSM 18658 / VKM B-2454 / MOB10) GN=Sinac_3151 PE=4 SV=1: DUF2752 [Tuwongella immobilis]